MPKTTKQRIHGLRERLIQLRGDRSQDEIAKKLNIARQTYGFYETGDREPNLSTLLKLSELYNVSTDYLLGHEKSTTHNREYIAQETGLEEAAIKGIQDLWINRKTGHEIMNDYTFSSTEEIREYWTEQVEALPKSYPKTANEYIYRTLKEKQEKCKTLKALNILLASNSAKNILGNLEAYLDFEHEPGEEEIQKTAEYNEKLGTHYKSFIKGKNGYFVASDYLNRAFLVAIQENLVKLKEEYEAKKMKMTKNNQNVYMHQYT